MILSFAEVRFDKPDPSFKAWIVGVTPSESMAGILKACPKIPAIGQFVNGWKCVKVEGTPENGSGGASWRVSARFEPVVEVAEESDEPQFPPYSGPKGKQPDGSFVFSPRMFHYLRAAWLWKGRDHMIRLPHGASHFDKLCEVIYEETGYASEELT